MPRIAADDGPKFWGELERMIEPTILQELGRGRSPRAAIEARLAFVAAKDHEIARRIARSVGERITGKFHHTAADILTDAERLLDQGARRARVHAEGYVPILERTSRDPLIPPIQQQRSAELADEIRAALRDPDRIPGSGFED